MTHRQRNEWRWLFVLAALLIAVAVAACAPESEEAEPTQAPAEESAPAEEPTEAPEEAAEPAAPTYIPMEDRTLVAYAVASKSVGANSLHLLIGEWLGYYAEEGLTIEYRTLGSYGASEAQLASGEANFGIGSWQVSMREYEEEGAPVGRFFYEFAYPTKQNFGVKVDDPYESLQDLAGKRVGIMQLDDNNVRMVTAWLNAAGMEFDDVEWVPLGADYAPQALAWQRGEVDAMFSEDSVWGVIEAQGLDFEFLPRPEGFPKVGGLSLSVTPAYIDENPEVVAGFGRASCKGTNFVLENLEAATWIFLQMFPEAAPAGDTVQEQVDALSKSVIYRAVKRDGYRSWDPEKKDICGWISPEEVADERDFQSFNVPDSDLGMFFTNEFSDQVNNFDKEAIREQARNFIWPQ
jgi:NitT/TauT family transport system substrate-binding protein